MSFTIVFWASPLKVDKMENLTKVMILKRVSVVMKRVNN
jgi:hypothetical protein